MLSPVQRKQLEDQLGDGRELYKIHEEQFLQEEEEQKNGKEMTVK